MHFVPFTSIQTLERGNTSNIVNAVLDGVDCVMLYDESVKGIQTCVTINAYIIAYILCNAHSCCATVL